MLQLHTGRYGVVAGLAARLAQGLPTMGGRRRRSGGRRWERGRVLPVLLIRAGNRFDPSALDC